MVKASEFSLEELERTCFVIMPFGQKSVGGKTLDFNMIYDTVFTPSIESVRTPENQPLIAKRTDKDDFSGSINQDMFEYLTYSRLAFADISGLNANVFYEIGIRHSMQESGTVLFRQAGGEIPFDIQTIKVFEYDLSQPDQSREIISRVLSRTLEHNRLDSPVRQALRAKWGGQHPQVSAPGTLSGGREPGEATGGPSVTTVEPVVSAGQSKVIVTVNVQ